MTSPSELLPCHAADAMPSGPGTYVLILFVESGTVLQIGRLGTFDISRGWYAYVGSAFGSGGLRARVRHHLMPVRRPHWHIDWFRTAAVVREVWYAQDVALEHAWALALLDMPGAFIAVPRFGASDCRCPSHLIGFAAIPDIAAFASGAGVALGHAQIDASSGVRASTIMGLYSQ